MSYLGINGYKSHKKTLLIIFMGIAFSLFSCGSKENTGFDGTNYDISLDGNGSLRASIDKIDGGYKLEISGYGESKNFSNEDKTPWYSISRKIKEVVINEGIVSLGENLLTKIDIPYYVLPSTVTDINKFAFDSDATLYLMSQEVNFEGDNKLYYYSETMPTDKNKSYWHYINEVPTIWVISQIKALFIGNSFTYYNDIPKITESIAKDIGYDFVSESVTKGSHTLEQFSNSNDEYGKIVDQKLNANNNYDYVILQEQSTRSYSNFDSFSSSVGKLLDKINSTQESCETRLYETWGYNEEAVSKQMTIPELEDLICEKYDTVAKKFNLNVHYVGKGFSEVYTNYPSINLYHEDNKHPSYSGSYLSALIHVGSIFNCDVRITNFNGSLSDEDATILKEVAYNVVFNK